MCGGLDGDKGVRLQCSLSSPVPVLTAHSFLQDPPIPTPSTQGPATMACLHDTRTPSPSFGGFVSTLSEASMRKLDPDTSDCTPEKDLTPTQCVLRDVVPLTGQGGGGGPSPSPGGEAPPEPFANSVLQLHEQEAGGPGGATGSPESRASRVRADEVRLQCQSGSGFLEGLFGCLRPVWTMIGKAYSTEHKQQQEGRCQWPWGAPPSLRQHSDPDLVVYASYPQTSGKCPLRKSWTCSGWALGPRAPSSWGASTGRRWL